MNKTQKLWAIEEATDWVKKQAENYVVEGPAGSPHLVEIRLEIRIEQGDTVEVETHLHYEPRKPKS